MPKHARHEAKPTIRRVMLVRHAVHGICMNAGLCEPGDYTHKEPVEFKHKPWFTLYPINGGVFAAQTFVFERYATQGDVDACLWANTDKAEVRAAVYSLVTPNKYIYY